jgi:hypothetical protein
MGMAKHSEDHSSAPDLVDELVRIVEETTASQGRPVLVDDPVALARIRRVIEKAARDADG